MNVARFWTLAQNVDIADLDVINFQATPTLTTTFDNIVRTPGTGNFQPGIPNDRFAASFQGRILIPQTGNWTFTLISDDGSRLYLDDVLVLDHDGLHSPIEKSVYLPWLEAGLHQLEVRMFENLGVTASLTGPAPARRSSPCLPTPSAPSIFDQRTPITTLTDVGTVPVTAVATSVTPGVHTFFRLVAADDRSTNVTATSGFAVPHPAAGLAVSFNGRDGYAQINLNPAETDTPLTNSGPAPGTRTPACSALWRATATTATSTSRTGTSPPGCGAPSPASRRSSPAPASTSPMAGGTTWRTVSAPRSAARSSSWTG